MSSSPVLEPANSEEVAGIVQMSSRLIVRGGGSKPGLSTLRDRDGEGQVLATSGLNGIVEYLPEEYTITAQAGTPLAAVELELAKHRQYLPFDPPFSSAGATVGGTVASGLNGPGRIRFGGLRDFVLGVRFVDGQGREVLGGGKVVKNAAGFDLPKLMVGSCGALGVLTEVTFKVFPAPEDTVTLVARVAGTSDLLQLHQKVALAGMELQALAVGVDLRLSVRIGGRAGALDARQRRLSELLPADSEVLVREAEARHWLDLTGTSNPLPERPSVLVPLDLGAATTLLTGLMDAPLEGGVSWCLLGGGAMAWLSCDAGSLGALSKLLRVQMLSAQAFTGERVGRLGYERDSAFFNRVVGVLDPRGLFISPGLDSLNL